MPITELIQPEMLQIEDGLRLRAFDGICAFAHAWYQDTDLTWLVDGVREPYTMEKLNRMYRYLNSHGELYFIEVLENGDWKPIGDVTFWQRDMPIVIGEKDYRGKHIGRKVLSALIKRGRELGYSHLVVNEIYEYNIGSRKCFESLGFRPFEKTPMGHRYERNL